MDESTSISYKTQFDYFVYGIDVDFNVFEEFASLSANQRNHGRCSVMYFLIYKYHFIVHFKFPEASVHLKFDVVKESMSKNYIV